MYKSNFLTRTTGRAKCSIAKVIVWEKLKNKTNHELFFNISKKKKINYREFFISNENAILKIEKFFNLFPDNTRYLITIKVKGGGKTGKLKATILGLARAFKKVSPDNDQILHDNKLLTVDSRIKEERKIGRKKARKSPQTSKR